MVILPVPVTRWSILLSYQLYRPPQSTWSCTVALHGMSSDGANKSQRIAGWGVCLQLLVYARLPFRPSSWLFLDCYFFPHFKLCGPTHSLCVYWQGYRATKDRAQKRVKIPDLRSLCIYCMYKHLARSLVFYSQWGIGDDIESWPQFYHHSVDGRARSWRGWVINTQIHEQCSIFKSDREFLRLKYFLAAMVW